MIRDTGTILKLQPLGEAGLIVTWCMAERGIVRTAARNARRPGSEWCGRLDLFHECELTYTPAKQGDLHSLSTVTLLEPRLELRAKLLKLQLSGYLARLLLATVETESNESCWHTLMAGALNYISTAALRPAILTHFEKRMAELHGIYTPIVPPAHALQQHFHRLPSGRAELLEQLRDEAEAS